MLTLTNDYPWQPTMSPVCYLCGAAPRKNADWPSGEPIVHTGKYIEMEGWLLICGSCWTEGARLFGWTPPSDLATQNTENQQLRARIIRVEAELQQATEGNRLLAKGFLDGLLPDTTTVEEPVEDEPVKAGRGPWKR